MKRILFVDDEPLVLEGLRSMLRPQRKRWEMIFAGGGDAALAEMAREPVDVVVSDMRMPGMDGAALLRVIQQRHPGVVRIVLSGFAELETALRTVPVAHQFLVKPCDARMLENVVERACALNALIEEPAVRGLVGKFEHLPSLPDAYVELTREISNDHAKPSDIARIIEADPDLCAKVLQLVNSAFLGLGRDIADIEQAVSYLGTNMVKNLALTVQVFGQPSRSPVDNLWVHRLQRHSLLVGTIARRMVAANKQMAENAFIAGILHDVGKLLMFTERAEALAGMQAKARSERRPLHQVEYDAQGATHAELGGYLLGIWGLPYPVVEAVANHHAPRRVAQPQGYDVLSAVYAANVLAHEQAALQGGEDEAFSPMDEDYLKSQGIADELTVWRDIAATVTGASRATLWAHNDEGQAA